MRTYEFMFVVDPRLSEEEATKLAEEYKRMITSADGELTREESWGKRKLAYPINRLNEAYYFLYYVACDGKNPLPNVEHRMRQNDQILRYLTVRTDNVRGAMAPDEAEAQPEQKEQAAEEAS